MRVTLDQALEILNHDGVVAIPTETVYGLAGSIHSDKALQKIFSVKDRPFFDPLIVHTYSLEQVKEYVAEWSQAHVILANAFWPGPFTMIIKKNDLINPLITAGFDKVGIRIPNHPLTLELLKKIKAPVAAPSANKFKKVSPTSAQHVEDEFDSKIAVLDGGECLVGIESTVVEVFSDKVLVYRPGMITTTMIKDALKKHGLERKVELAPSPVAPGQIEHHYQPKVPFIVLFGNEMRPTGFDYSTAHEFTLHLDAKLAARELYQKMREHAEGASCLILHLPGSVKHEEDWLGILNRLKKAAAFFG